MPQAIPAIVVTAKTVGVAAAIKLAAVAALKFVAVAAATSFLSKKLNAYDPGIQARAVTARGTVEPHQKIYGRALVSGPVFFIESGGAKNATLYIGILLAAHQVSAIGDVWLDDRVVVNADINGGAAAGGNVTAGTFGPQSGITILKINKHLGTPTQAADADLVAAFPSNWTSAHQLRGNAYLTAAMVLFSDSAAVWDTGEPTNIRALVDGALVYDPRLDSTNGGSGSHRYTDPTTWEWSSNPALCAADFLMDASLGYGEDPATGIDWASVAATADYCDTLVDIPGPATEKRFTCNGVIYGTGSRKENLESILSSCNGEAVLVSGVWSIRAGYTAPGSDDTLNADQVAGPVSIRTALEREERFNTIRAVFMDPDQQYQPTETPPITTAALLTSRDDDVVLENEITLPMTAGFYEAQRVAWQHLHLANQETSILVPTNLAGAILAAGERFNFTVDELGWAPKVFRGRSFRIVDSGGDDGLALELEAREDSASAWADPDVGDYATRAASGALTLGSIGVPTATALSGTSAPGGYWARWTNPPGDSLGDDWDYATLWASPDSDWANAVPVWLGTADSAFIELAAGLTRYLWVTHHTDNGPPQPEDARFPDSDTSSVSVVAGAVPPLPNLMPLGYGDFEIIDTEQINISGIAGSASGAISTAQAWLGERSLQLEAQIGGSKGVLALYSGYSSVNNIKALPNRRYLVIVSIYPSNTDAQRNLTFYLGDGVGTIASATKDLSALAPVGEWTRLAFEIDRSASASQDLHLQQEWLSGATATTSTPTFYTDGVVLLDVTDHPQLTEDNFPPYFIPPTGSFSGGVSLDGGARITAGDGDPEGVVAAPPGSVRVANDTGAVYQKASGTGNTGWVQLATIDALPQLFTSSEQTITLGTTTAVNHGLGRLPDGHQVVIRCTTANLGYAVGEEVMLSDSYGDYGQMSYANATQVGIHPAAAGIHIISKTTDAGALITTSSWRWVLRAWIFP